MRSAADQLRGRCVPRSFVGLPSCASCRELASWVRLSGRAVAVMAGAVGAGRGGVTRADGGGGVPEAGPRRRRERRESTERIATRTPTATTTGAPAAVAGGAGYRCRSSREVGR